MAVTSQDIAKRWTPTLVKSGFTPISNYFIENYHRLVPALTSLEAMLVIHLMRFKWDERHPHPTFGTLSRRMGVSPTATRNHARSLQKKRFLNRLSNDGGPNSFDLTPLFDALERLYLADVAAHKVKEPPIRLTENYSVVEVRTGRAIELDEQEGASKPTDAT
jgi:DNA-binding IclR family transcriptional regulator